MSDGEWKYVPPAYEMADSLLNMAQHVEIGKTKFTAPAAAFLREAADRIQRQHDEIERLRASLQAFVTFHSGHVLPPELVNAMLLAREALGDGLERSGR